MELSAEMTTTLNTPRYQYSHQTLFRMIWSWWCHHTHVNHNNDYSLSRYRNKQTPNNWHTDLSCISQISGWSSKSCLLSYQGNTGSLAQFWRDRTRDFSWLLQYFCKHCDVSFAVLCTCSALRFRAAFHIHINWQSSHEHKIVSLKKCFIIHKHTKQA